MLEQLLIKAEFSKNLISIFFITFIITLITGVLNYFISGNFLILITLSCLFLAYPIINFLNKEYFNFTSFSFKKILEIELNDIKIFLTFFLSLFFAFLILLNLNLITDVSYIKNNVDNITGNFLNDTFFLKILINNLYAILFTFLLSVITSSGFILTIIYNSAIFSYFIYISENLGLVNFLLVLPHGIVEISGFILAGFAGFLLSLKINNLIKKENNSKYNFSIREVLFILLISVLLIFFAAFLEVL